MTSIEFYERDTVIKRIGDNLNQINQRYFEGNHGILSVTDNGDYVTVKRQGLSVADYDTQKLFDALENFSQEDREFLFPYGLWDYLDHCKYIPQEDQRSDNQLKTDNELSFSEKRQVALVDWLLGEPVITETSISNEELWEKSQQLTNLAQRLKWENLELTQSLEEMHNLRRRELKEGSEIINHLTARVHELEQKLKQQIKTENSGEQTSKPKPKPEKKTAKKSKFKLPENFADYQQECDGLIDALSCFYSIKKGKWNRNILQFILTPTDAEKAKHWLCPIPDKWKAGLYLQTARWSVDKVNLSDPDEWSDWYIDIYDFADANDIEIS
jgi:hypothetical protein